jgi:sigma-B regulation protein RsbU (phosphoserine phosphatase)
MFTTLRSKLFFFITLTMLVTALGILYFTYRDVGDAMRQAGRDSAQNVLNLVQLNIQSTYLKMQADKIATVRDRRENLRDSAQIVATVVERVGRLVTEGKISEERYRAGVLDWLGTVKFPQQVGVFAFDLWGKVLVHTDDSRTGINMTDVRDLKQRNLGYVMRTDRVSPRGDFAVFHWDTSDHEAAGKQMAYFIPVPELELTLGTVVPIGNIETEAQAKLDEAINNLANILSDIHIAKTGCAMVVDGHGRVLIPPCERQVSERTADTPGERKLIDTIVSASKRPDGSADYVDTAGGTRTELQIYASYFEPLDWYFAVYLPSEEIRQPARTLVSRQTLVIILIFVASLVIFFFLVSRISQPLNLLASHAKEIAGHDFSQPLPSEDPIDQALGKYRDEVGRLAQSFIFMKSELNKNIRNLMETTAANERILGELNVARSIQMGILPKIFPPFPDCDAIDLYALLEPAKSVGGDLYDFFFVDENHLCFTVGDVSDKGVPASLFMVITRTLIKILAVPGSGPAAIMQRINDTLTQDNPNAMFVTLLVGLIDIRTGHVRYANGGHNLPIIVVKGEEAVYRAGLSGPVVGALPEMTYSELELDLAPGDGLFLYTDGVTEAMDENHHLYSDPRLLEVVNRLADQSVREIVDGVMQDVGVHTAKAEYQSDDITIFMIRYEGEGKN